MTLVETVRQKRDAGLTIFDQEFIEWRGGRRSVHRFSIAFRTVTVTRMAELVAAAGFRIAAVLGDYRGRAWSPDAGVWVIIGRRA